MNEEICPTCGGSKYRYAAKCTNCSGNSRSEIREQYGQLTVLREVEPQGKNKYRTVEVRCTCGVVKNVRLAHLAAGRIVSCGCVARSTATTHGMSLTQKSEYNAWVSLNQRCTNPNNPRWKDYGGRGITVCSAWRDSFEAFLADMGPKPSPQHSIDRKDNDGNYEPDNCRWATRDEQYANRRPPARASAR